MANLLNKKFLVTLFILFFSVTAFAAPSSENDNVLAPECDENGDCLSNPEDCHEICGCDRSGLMAIYYNETTKSCVVNYKDFMFAEIKVYGQDDDDVEEGSTTAGGSMAKRIKKEAEKIFNTIMVSVILFISCCLACVVSACFYCCRINYTDYTLKNDVKALAKKLKRDGKLPKVSRKQPQSQANQSCNIVCEEAGVFVV